MLRRRPVRVLSTKLGRTSPSSNKKFFTCCTVRFGFCAHNNAAPPATCGVAIEVPLKNWYALLGIVLYTFSPGAPRSTLVAPKCENEDRVVSVWSIEATAMIFGTLKLEG